MHSEAVLNDKVTHGLKAQFSVHGVSAVLSQAQTMFQEANYRSGNNESLLAEPYELFEGGWVDSALEFLGFGPWAIGRPKTFSFNKSTLSPNFHRSSRSHSIAFVKPAVESRQSQGNPVLPDGVELFLKTIPGPFELRVRLPWQNSIEYRNLLVIGDQGSGKSTLTEALAYGLGLKYWNHPICAAKERAGLGALIAKSSYLRAEAYFLIGADLTLARIPRNHINAFFHIRHLIKQNSGISKGIVITGLETHTLFGIDKNLRASFSMFVKTVPTNPYDRGILRRYVDSQLLSDFEQRYQGDPSRGLYWHQTVAPHGIIVQITEPPSAIIADFTPHIAQQPIPWELIFKLAFMVTLFGGLAALFWYH